MGYKDAIKYYKQKDTSSYLRLNGVVRQKAHSNARMIKILNGAISNNLYKPNENLLYNGRYYTQLPDLTNIRNIDSNELIIETNSLSDHYKVHDIQIPENILCIKRRNEISLQLVPIVTTDKRDNPTFVITNHPFSKDQNNNGNCYNRVKYITHSEIFRNTAQYELIMGVKEKNKVSHYNFGKKEL